MRAPVVISGTERHETEHERVTATAVGALVIILLGAFARRVGVLRALDGPVLVQIVLYLAMPALVFRTMVISDLDRSLLLVPLAGFLIHGVLLAAGFAGARVMTLDRPATGALVVASAVGNTGFFGIPLIAASGPELSVATAIMYDTFCTTVLTWTSTVAIASLFGNDETGERRFTWSGAGRNLLLPPTWALAAGLALNAAGVRELPDVVDRPVEILAGAVLPLVLLYVGLVLEVAAARRAWPQVTFALVMRFCAGPALGLVAVALLGLDGPVATTVVLMASMPTAMMSLVIGGWHELRTDIIAGAVVVTTLLSTLALPLIRALL